MIVLSHRGMWKNKDERNSLESLAQSLSFGFGLELDIRDYCGDLVVSHDIPDNKSLLLKSFFEIYMHSGSNLTLALNIKADGLQVKLQKLLHNHNITNYFVFDMSVPDGLQYLNHNIKSFARESEYEKVLPFYEKVCGVWLDEFEGHWINKKVIEEHIEDHKDICIVSPELHNREYKKEWQHYKNIEKELGVLNLMICTDYPELAKEFFNEK